jgi:hypothetical protein
MRLFLFLFLVSVFVHADEFQALPALSQKINCQDVKRKGIQWKNCQTVKVNGEEYYTLEFQGTSNEGTKKKTKILKFEIADKNLKTLRSETIDQIEQGIDLPEENFKNTLKAEWGKSKKDARTMLKMELSNKENSEKSSYLIKLNEKKTWFENVF